MVSSTTWNSLTVEQQKAVKEGLEQAAAKSIDDAEKGDIEYMDMMEAKGMTVVRFDKTQLQEFARAVRENVWPRFADSFGDEFLNELIDSYN